MTTTTIHNSYTKKTISLTSNNRHQIIEFIKNNYPHKGVSSTVDFTQGTYDKTVYEGMWIDINGVTMTSRHNGVSWSKLDEAMASKPRKAIKPHCIEVWELNKNYYINICQGGEKLESFGNWKIKLK